MHQQIMPTPPYMPMHNSHHHQSGGYQPPPYPYPSLQTPSEFSMTFPHIERAFSTHHFSYFLSQICLRINRRRCHHTINHQQTTHLIHIIRLIRHRARHSTRYICEILNKYAIFILFVFWGTILPNISLSFMCSCVVCFRDHFVHHEFRLQLHTIQGNFLVNVLLIVCCLFVITRHSHMEIKLLPMELNRHNPIIKHPLITSNSRQ